MATAQHSAEVQGTVDPRFESVRDAFASNFVDFGEVGASVAVTVDGHPVVDLWGGFADAARTRPWQQDTLINLYSSTKGVTALAGAILAGRGELDYEARVSRYWPEFAQAGKADVLVRNLFDHSVGLPYLAEGATFSDTLDWPTAIGWLEGQEPVWAPGSETGYHAFTYGWLTGEVIRRISGRSVGAFVRDELAGPLGADFMIGTPFAEHDRVAQMVMAVRPPDMAAPGAGVLPPFALELHDALINAVNTPQFRVAELPAANGHGNARSLARIYGAMAVGGELGGVRIVDRGALELATSESIAGFDRALNRQVRRSFGYSLRLPGGRGDMGPNDRIFGHTGAGGSLGFADPDAHVGFGYAMNQMRLDPGDDPRWARLSAAVYSAL